MNLLPYFKHIFICCGLFLSLTCYGQTAFSGIPLGAMPMQFNPSFAGEAGAARFSSNFTYTRHSSPANSLFPSSNRYSSYSSFDHFIPALATGIGVTTGYDRMKGENVYRGDTYFLSLAVAPKISIKGKYTLSPSVDVRYESLGMTTNYDSFSSLRNRETIGTRAGLLFNTHKFYVGYSADLFTKYRSTYNGIEQREMKGFDSWLQLGYTFQRSSESDFSFTPQLAVRLAEKMHPDDKIISLVGANFNFKYKHYIGGLSRGLYIGYQNENLRLMLGHSFGVFSGHVPSSNLSFRYIFKSADKMGTQSRF